MKMVARLLLNRQIGSLQNSKKSKLPLQAPFFDTSSVFWPTCDQQNVLSEVNTSKYEEKNINGRIWLIIVM
jgi:hypothetical protein